MTINPIIPIWLMSVICVGLLILKRKGVWPFIRQILMVILIFIINLRPMIPGETINLGEQKMNVYVLFVVDDTISMLAEDYNGNHKRIEGVKEDCKHVVDELPGAKFGIITFHNAAMVLSPFTDNATHIYSVLDGITPVMKLYAQGTSLDIPKNVMYETLEHLCEKKNAMTVVFYISDGEMNTDTKRESFEEVSKYVDRGAVLGYGTTAGGKMKVAPYQGAEEEVVEDHSTYPSEPAISKINEKNLKDIASELNVSYINMNHPAELDQLIADVRNHAETIIDNGQSNRTNKIETQTDIFFYFVAPLVLLLFIEMILFVKKKTS